jgi:gamma-glutamylcyclotransferase (GGCT)/AIG2-like uncharacterized protein YtfP
MHGAGNIFTYGSLMFNEVWSKVVRGTYEHVDAGLYGYQRKKVKGQAYPCVFPAGSADYVHGKLYRGVVDEDICSLDRFEGEYYQREWKECELSDGSKLPAWVYVFKKQYTYLIGAEDWDPDRFSRVGMYSFLSEYRGFP